MRQKKCDHKNTENRLVTFRNGTQHVQIYCFGCERKIGFTKKIGIEIESLPIGTTTRAERESVGLPVGCLGCGVDWVRVTGFCGDCEKTGIHKVAKRYAKDRGLTVWKLSKEQFFEIYGEKETK